MRPPPHIYALTAALAVTTALVLVVGGDPAPEPQPVVVAEVLGAEFEPSSTTMDLEFFDDAAPSLVLPEAEIDPTGDAVNSSTTTTVPTTAPAQAPAPKSDTSKPKTTAPTTTTQPPSPPPTVAAEFRSDYESDFYGRINSLRASNGLTALARNGSLDARARDWAKTMADSGSLKHSDISSLVPPFSASAENVGKGGSVSSIFGLFKGSSSHVVNMTGNYTDVGIGVWRDSNGTLWTAHVFTR